VLGFARDLGWINWLDAVHIHLVALVVLHSDWLDLFLGSSSDDGSQMEPLFAYLCIA
jgi:hypothetical protein